MVGFAKRRGSRKKCRLNDYSGHTRPRSTPARAASGFRPPNASDRPFPSAPIPRRQREQPLAAGKWGLQGRHGERTENPEREKERPAPTHMPGRARTVRRSSEAGLKKPQKIGSPLRATCRLLNERARRRCEKNRGRTLRTADPRDSPEANRRYRPRRRGRRNKQKQTEGKTTPPVGPRIWEKAGQTLRRRVSRRPAPIGSAALRSRSSPDAGQPIHRARRASVDNVLSRPY